MRRTCLEGCEGVSIELVSLLSLSTLHGSSLLRYGAASVVMEVRFYTILVERRRGKKVGDIPISQPTTPAYCERMFINHVPRLE